MEPSSPAPYTNTATKHAFSRSDLEMCADGRLFGIGNAQLPTAPLLMLDRIIDIQRDGGEYDRGFAIAELDLDPNSWFFKHHFKGDPLVPGSLIIESLWQLTGFHLAWSGCLGKGRVLDSGNTRFLHPVGPTDKTLRITINIRKLHRQKNTICVANGYVTTVTNRICSATAMKVGLYI